MIDCEAMAYYVTSRWGGDEPNAPIDRMREVLTELDVEDSEHPCVSLTHESEWSLGAYSGGLIVWENLEDGDAMHMNDVSRDLILELWIQLSEGNLGVIQQQPWLPGYED